MSVLELRELTGADAPRCAELERVLFPGDNPWTAADFLMEFAQPHNNYIGVVDKDNPRHLLGYAGLARLGPLKFPEYEIHTIGVDPAHHRRGIARLMMDHLISLADADDAPIFLEVRTDNDPAITLYQSYGFIHIGLRKNYYQPSGADAFVMCRSRKSER
ncbi:MAG: ribosomal protein S18-alanine N-acetyltransferase [Corynebacterium sp.]|uniref:ribosomal protein S18-alanine N-acetyltransferase n=1 Tax=Corynebacterium sp. TaxID=1720 RepID=UPI0026DAA068|nr:ribosomal protein S18-alanine N-acetyltransferase [Corynebacterium sp.]MDO5099627.1 ribosomal protein S18-alanine N-acetyltransferase [Corynebacterium sp.]